MIELLGVCVVFVSVGGTGDEDFAVLEVSIDCLVLWAWVVRIKVAEEVYECPCDVGLGVIELELVLVFSSVRTLTRMGSGGPNGIYR